MGSVTRALERAREWRYTPVLAYVLVVLVLAWIVWDRDKTIESQLEFIERLEAQQAALEAQQAALEAEAQQRAVGNCSGSIEGRSMFMVFGEVMIEASARGRQEPEPGRQERVDYFRSLIDDFTLSKQSPSCKDVITKEQYEDQVRETVADLLAPAGSPDGGVDSR